MNRPIIARHVDGRFHRARAAISLVLQGLLFVLPWLQFHGRQAFLLDLANRKLYLGSWVLFPQETPFLLLILLMAGLTLFLSTAIAGRMWCGYACPQTLFSQSFMTVERWLEGDRAKRLRHPPGLLRRSLKWAIWAMMGIWLGITVSGYLHPIRHLTLANWPLVAFFTFVSLLDFGFLREMVCHNWCPYARFQGAMFDRDSLIIAYDQERGEPRGKQGKGKGGCVDCSLCVQVCPMGIDIRDGNQLECIACAACVDACDQVMDRVKQPRGLIRYSSESGQQRVLRPRTVAYMILWLCLAGLFAAMAFGRQPLTLDVVRSATLYTQTPDGRVANGYTVHLVNRLDHPVTVSIELDGPPAAELLCPQGNPVTLEAASVRALPVTVVAPRTPTPVVPLKFKVQEAVCETTFVSPGP